MCKMLSILKMPYIFHEKKRRKKILLFRFIKNKVCIFFLLPNMAYNSLHPRAIPSSLQLHPQPTHSLRSMSVSIRWQQIAQTNPAARKKTHPTLTDDQIL